MPSSWLKLVGVHSWDVRTTGSAFNQKGLLVGVVWRSSSVGLGCAPPRSLSLFSLICHGITMDLHWDLSFGTNVKIGTIQWDLTFSQVVWLVPHGHSILAYAVSTPIKAVMNTVPAPFTAVMSALIRAPLAYVPGWSALRQHQGGLAPG
eukprot:1159462-Pelagomonas_calceolata.AAC.14